MSESRDDHSFKGASPPTPGIPHYRYPPGYHQDEITVRDLWTVVVSSKWLIIVIIFATTVLAVLYAIAATPIFRAETLLAPVESAAPIGLGGLAGRFGGLADLAGLPLQKGSGEVETALATLESREFIARFINEMNIKPELFPERWDAEKREWIRAEPTVVDKIRAYLKLDAHSSRSAEQVSDEPSDWEAHERFKDDVIGVTKELDTGLVTVAVEWSDPNLAAQWANQLVERLNSELRERAIVRAEKSISYLQQQVKQTSVADLRLVLFRLIEEHTKTITLAKVNEEYVFEVIDPAVAPERKTRPRGSVIAVLGLAFGIMLGLFAAFARAALTHFRQRESSPEGAK